LMLRVDVEGKEARHRPAPSRKRRPTPRLIDEARHNFVRSGNH
jgi:hypothetical protein